MGLFFLFSPMRCWPICHFTVRICWLTIYFYTYYIIKKFSFLKIMYFLFLVYKPKTILFVYRMKTYENTLLFEIISLYMYQGKAAAAAIESKTQIRYMWIFRIKRYLLKNRFILILPDVFIFTQKINFLFYFCEEYFKCITFI